MHLLLDTHALLWWWTDDKRLSKKVASAIANEENLVLISAASAWEIATKFRIGKMPKAQIILDQFNNLILADNFTHLPINYQHSLRAGSYAVEHRDPFDRILVAQSEIENTLLVSLDPAMQLLGARLFW